MIYLVDGFDPGWDLGWGRVLFKGDQAPHVMEKKGIRVQRKDIDKHGKHAMEEWLLEQVKRETVIDGHPQNIEGFQVAWHMEEITWIWAIECPTTDNAVMRDKTIHDDGRITKGAARAVTAANDWRIIGSLRGMAIALGIHFVLVTPGQAKEAVGLGYHEKRKPVREVELITGVDLQGLYKYQMGAAADAIAVAIKGEKLYKLKMKGIDT